MDSHISQFKFVQALITTLRQISIYPPRHPSIINSIKTVLSALNLIFIEQEKFTINLSPDKILFLQGQPVQQKDMPLSAEFIRLFERLGVDDLMFVKGVTEEELEGFIQIIVSSSGGSKADINKLFAEKSVTHIIARQFSYLKVEKGTEGVLAGKANPAEELKSRVKAFCQGDSGGAGKEDIEKDIFGMIGEEMKGKRQALGRFARLA